MGDQDGVIGELTTLLDTQARTFKESLSRIEVGSTPADCKEGLTVKTSPHILKVLGLVNGQGLFPVVEMEPASIVCCELLVRLRLQGGACSP